MKYLTKPKIVEAYLFELGKEDGFLSENCYIPANAHEFPEKYRSTIYPRYHKDYEGVLSNFLRCGIVDPIIRPYIDFPNEGKIPVPFGSYIVINGHDIDVYSKEDFEEEFFPYKEGE